MNPIRREAARQAGHPAVACLLGVLALMPFPGAIARAQVAVEVDPTSSACAVRGRFHVDLPPSAAWSVVADYDHIPDFVRSML